MRYFEALGLPVRLLIDLEDLETRFYSRSRELHPDRFARATADVRQRALDASSVLNDAYRTLKNPVSRAEYLLTENGFDIAEQRSKDVPPELLEEVFELNMALEELKGGDESVRPQLAGSKAKFEAMLGEIEVLMAAESVRFDAGDDALPAIRGILNRRRYIENLLRDVNGHLSN